MAMMMIIILINDNPHYHHGLLYQKTIQRHLWPFQWKALSLVQPLISLQHHCECQDQDKERVQKNSCDVKVKSLKHLNMKVTDVIIISGSINFSALGVSDPPPPFMGDIGVQPVKPDKRWALGWGLKTKSWWIDSAIAKFIAFGHTFAMKIIFSPQNRFSSPWVFVWKPENPHYGVKNQNCRRPMVWPIKTCARRALSQRKKLELNRTYQFREKSKKPPERTGGWKLVNELPG